MTAHKLAPFLRFERNSSINASADELFRWHARPGAFERLSPPWETIEIVERDGSIYPGDRLSMKLRKGPIWLPWVAEHGEVIEGSSFEDQQVKGPFRHWHHLHRFFAEGPETSRLSDRVHYRLFGGQLVERLARKEVEKQLDRMFTYRHATTVEDLAQHSLYHDQPRLHVAMTGASGLIGSSLAALLTTGGHRVTRLVRRRPGSSDEVQWSTEKGLLSPLGPVDAFVHLAGENVGQRWTRSTKLEILKSRSDATRHLIASLAREPSPPKTFLCASAVGIYGNRSQRVDESASAGDGFLSSVVRAWEEEASKAGLFADRVLNARLGVVLTPRGGALKRMLPPFTLGLGGPLGHGRQPMSWIGLDDAIGALLHLLMTPSLSGPVNLAAPEEVTNGDFTKTLGRVLKRPAVLPMPAAAVKLAFGDMGREMLLQGAHVTPTALTASGYKFRHATLESTLRHGLGLPEGH